MDSHTHPTPGHDQAGGVAGLATARTVVREAILDLRPLVTQSREGLTLVVLARRSRRALGGAGPVRSPLAFAEAAASGAVTVTEASHASVPSVLAEAHGADVLVLDGDTLLGGLQDRVVNVSIWLKAGKPVPIPVSCMEAGRWRDGRVFSAGRAADPLLRSLIAASVADRAVGQPGTARGRPAGADGPAWEDAESARDAFVADQGGVWREIDARQSRSGRRSPTSALRDVWDADGDELAATVAAFALPPDAVGVAVGLFDRIVSVDAFDDPAMLASAWPRIVAAAAAAWLDRRRAIRGHLVTAPVRRHPDEGAVGRLLRRAVTALEGAAVGPSVGAGMDVRLVGDRVHGSGLVVEGRVVHLSLFRRERPETPDRLVL